MDISTLKKDLAQTLYGINKDKLSLPDLKLYADLVKTVSEIQEKSYMDVISSVFPTGFNSNSKPATVSELK